MMRINKGITFFFMSNAFFLILPENELIALVQK